MSESHGRDGSRTMDYGLPPSLAGQVGRMRETLCGLLTSQRLARFSEVVAQRSRRILPVFEDTNHSHNISAVLRSADAFGFQDALFVFQRAGQVVRHRDCVERGASDWLTLRHSESLLETVEVLHRSSYKIALVSLPSFFVTAKDYRSDLPSFTCEEIGSARFHEFLGPRRLAVVFGNEAEGLVPEWAEYADAYLNVPMRGFVESLNLSVCAGILLQRLREICVEKANTEGLFLSEFETKVLLDLWSLRSSGEAGARLIQSKDRLLQEYSTALRKGHFLQPFQCG